MIPAGNAGQAQPGSAQGSTSLRYPYDQIGSDNDYVLFTFYDYVAPFSAQGQGQDFQKNTATVSAYNNSSASGLKNSTGSVIMYMPEDIQGEYGAQWQDTNLSNMARGALGLFGSAANGDLGQAISNVADTLGKAGENAISKGTLVSNILSDALQKSNFASLTVNDVFASTTGQILNPNTEVLYKGPMMRNFSLQFKMVPNNNDDAIRIRKIIHTFKYATLPKYGGSGDKETASFVKVPQIVDVSFMKGSSLNPWVTQFKPCVIKNVSVSYTPDGTWARLPNGSPVATTLSLQFQETKMVFADELTEGGPSY